MKITWNGHACFTLDCEDGTIVFDPYEDNSIPGLKPLKLEANEVLCSHQHFDHNATSVVEIDKDDCTFNIETISTYHDEVQGAKRGNNTVHIVNTEGMKVVHLGDIGHDLDVTPIKDCDVLMIPIGGTYTINNQEAIALTRKINPRIILPMHYKTEKYGFDVLETLDGYIDEFKHIQVFPSNCITVEEDTAHMVAILNIDKLTQ